MLKVTELLTTIQAGFKQTVWLQSLWAVKCSTRAMPRDLKVISKKEDLHKLLFLLHSYTLAPSTALPPYQAEKQHIRLPLPVPIIPQEELASVLYLIFSPCFILNIKSNDLYSKKTPTYPNQNKISNKTKIKQQRKKQVTIFKSHCDRKALMFIHTN